MFLELLWSIPIGMRGIIQVPRGHFGEPDTSEDSGAFRLQFLKGHSFGYIGRLLLAWFIHLCLSGYFGHERSTYTFVASLETTWMDEKESLGLELAQASLQVMEYIVTTSTVCKYLVYPHVPKQSRTLASFEKTAKFGTIYPSSAIAVFQNRLQSCFTILGLFSFYKRSMVI